MVWRQPPPIVATLTGGGLFSDYEWLPDEYAIYLKHKQDERKEKERKQQAVGKGRAFYVGMNQYSWKYHDCFLPEEK